MINQRVKRPREEEEGMDASSLGGSGIPESWVLELMKDEGLIQLCQANRLDATGNRDELIGRLSTAAGRPGEGTGAALASASADAQETQIGTRTGNASDGSQVPPMLAPEYGLGGRAQKRPKGEKEEAQRQVVNAGQEVEKAIKKKDKAEVPPISFKGLLKIGESAPFVLEYSEFEGKEELQKKLLGPLHKEGEQWPIVNGRIDMRFDRALGKKEQSSSSSGDGVPDLRPAAAKLSKEITNKVYFFIAICGAGKTSSIFDLAREHFVLYLQCSTPEELVESDIHKQRRYSRESDRAFSNYVVNVRAKIRKEEARSRIWLHQNWETAKRFAFIELLARLMLLLRLHNEYTKEFPGQIITPWMFLIQQHQNEHYRFVEHFVDALRDVSMQNAKDLLKGLIVHLENMNLIAGFKSGKKNSSKHQLVIAIDEMETGAQTELGEFLDGRLEAKLDEKIKSDMGIISPFLSACGELDSCPIVLAGARSSNERAKHLKAGIGKNGDGIKHIYSHDDFSMADGKDCIAMLSRLSLPEEAFKILKQSLMMRAHPDLADRPGTLENWIDLTRWYLVNSRFRLLSGTIESIPKVMRQHQSPDNTMIEEFGEELNDFIKGIDTVVYENEEKAKEGRLNSILHAAMRLSIKKHHDRLLELLRDRLLESESVSKETIRVRLEYLSKVFYGSKYSMQASFPFILDRHMASFDLSAIGITGIFVTDRRSFSYRISERFVLDVIEQALRTEPIEEIASPLIMQRLIEAANDNLSNDRDVGKCAEAIFLQAFVEQYKKMKKEKKGGVVTVGGLPLFKLIPKNQQICWKNVPFEATHVRTSPPDSFLPPTETDNSSLSGARTKDNFYFPAIEHLASENAIGVVISPENSCGPDGIIMLRDGPDNDNNKNTRGRMLAKTTTPSVIKVQHKRRAVTLGSAVYKANIGKGKIVSQYRSCDFSRAYLGKNRDDLPINSVKKRKAWELNGLHDTICLRILVFLPETVGKGNKADKSRGVCRAFENRLGEIRKDEENNFIFENKIEDVEALEGDDEEVTDDDEDQEKKSRKNLKVSFKESNEEEKDAVIFLDRTNLHLLIGNRQDNEALYDMLERATGKEISSL